MAKRMLIDASHPEETRVAVISGNRLEDFDFETAAKKPLKGNIYLAKIVRVEPSLQAAFVDFGGNRHGFLAFNEIHPDYYRIPIADREALLAEEKRLAEAGEIPVEVDEEETGDEAGSGDSGPDGNGEAGGDETAFGAETGEETETGEPFDEFSETAAAEEFLPAEADKSLETGAADDLESEAEDFQEIKPLDTLSEDEFDVPAPRNASLYRRYKIQEVIFRNQVILVQVVKEERGNKGAALTTRLSLAGRYCVLMPNTDRGGGISRKISNASDRRKLKEILDKLNIPEGMAVIVRTAGLARTKAEIKRDYEYLLRLWNDIRDVTMKSSAPAQVYEEASIIRRAIRDLYTRDMEEVLADSEESYRTAKEYMRRLMPSHAKKVKRYRDESIPLLHRYQVEAQIDAIHNPTVQLKSGGYLVLNQTEALVAIDVNSGRSTRERNIEETALKTNCEAADEIARQLRLRDLAGLIVIDFIDMEIRRNQITVEKRMKEALKSDRARIQISRISGFGLMEMSRQRLRPSLSEFSTRVCPYCGGAGHIRSTESTALHVLRAVEEEGLRKRNAEISISVPTEVALYILNQKRGVLAAIEARHGLRVSVHQDDSLIPPDFRLEGVKAATADGGDGAPDSTAGEEAAKPAPRRRGRRGKRPAEETAAEEVEAVEVTFAETPEEEESEADKPARKKRRRGKRGGRRRSRKTAAEKSPEAGGTEAGAGEIADSPPRAKPRRSRRPRKDAGGGEAGAEANAAVAAPRERQEQEVAADGESKRRGWWQRLLE